MIHTNIMRQDGKSSEAKAGNIHSVPAKYREENQVIDHHQLFGALITTSIRTPETTIFPSAYLKPRRPGKRMRWIYIPQKQWMSGGWVLIHEFSRTTSESRWGLVYGLGFVHRCRDTKIRYMKQCDGYIRLKPKPKKSVSQSFGNEWSAYFLQDQVNTQNAFASTPHRTRE